MARTFSTCPACGESDVTGTQCWECGASLVVAAAPVRQTSILDRAREVVTEAGYTVESGRDSDGDATLLLRDFPGATSSQRRALARQTQQTLFADRGVVVVSTEPRHEAALISILTAAGIAAR